MCAWRRKAPLQAGRLTPDEARAKAERYCAYQDRCHQEVRRKLFDLGLRAADVDQVMARLIEDKFLDEERFARSYARGKFRIKRWGRRRIERELRARQVSRFCIRAGLSELDGFDYEGALEALLRKRAAALGDDLHPYARRQNLLEHALRKGYETEVAVAVATRIVPR